MATNYRLTVGFTQFYIHHYVALLCISHRMLDLLRVSNVAFAGQQRILLTLLLAYASRNEVNQCVRAIERDFIMRWRFILDLYFAKLDQLIVI